MKVDIGREGPASAMRCDLYLEGADDPPFVRIHRGGVVVAEAAVNMVSDAETLRREVEIARRLEVYPRRLHDTLSEMSGDEAGFPDDGTPERRRQLYASGFLAALRAEKPEKLQKQTWLRGYEAGKKLLSESNELILAFRTGRERPAK